MARESSQDVTDDGDCCNSPLVTEVVDLASAEEDCLPLGEDKDDDHLADAVVGEEVAREEQPRAPVTALEEVGSFMYRCD